MTLTTDREKECILIGAVLMAGRLSDLNPLHKPVFTREYHLLRDFLALEDEQVKETVHPEAGALRHLLQKFSHQTGAVLTQ